MDPRLKRALLVLRVIPASTGYSCLYTQVAVRELMGLIGFQLLGEGAYAAVFAYPGDRVVRVSLSAADPHREYIRRIRRVRRSWVPKVYLVRDAGSIQVTVLERLRRQRRVCSAVGVAIHIPDATVWMANHKPREFKYDIHRNNVMSRSDGTLVVTDPWSHRPYSHGEAS